jgi:flagellar protein FlaG
MSDLTTIDTQLSLVSNVTATVEPTKVDAVVAERQEVSESGKVSPQEATQKVDAEEVVQAVIDITEYVQNISRDLQFQVDKQTGDTIVTVLDTETKAVIRQIPSEEVVAMARYIAENAPDPVKGLLMNGEG